MSGTYFCCFQAFVIINDRKIIILTAKSLSLSMIISLEHIPTCIILKLHTLYMYWQWINLSVTWIFYDNCYGTPPGFVFPDVMLQQPLLAFGWTCVSVWSWEPGEPLCPDVPSQCVMVTQQLLVKWTSGWMCSWCECQFTNSDIQEH